MEIKVRCPHCKFEIELKGGTELKSCPVCKYSIQTESAKVASKQILKDAGMIMGSKGILND